MPGKHVKVVSLNIWNGKYLDRIVEFLRQVGADVMLLQEVPNGRLGEDEANVYTRLVDELRLEAVWGAMWRVMVEGGSYEKGLAIISRWPIKRYWGRYYFKGLVEMRQGVYGPDKSPGLLLGAEVDIGGITLTALTTHFVWSMHPGTNKQQLAAAPKLSECLEKVEGKCIFGGDLNTTRDSEVFTTIASGLSHDLPSELDNTLHPNIHKVGGSKKIAVDHLFHRGAEICWIKTQVPIVPVSDHLPVVAEYQIN